MEGKLIKKITGSYKLEFQGNLIASSDEDMNRDLGIGKLSLKNCQAIEKDSPLEEYVLEVYGEGWDDHLYKGSRKKTEWDVEVKMICPHPEDTYVCGIQYGCDEDGCNHPNKSFIFDGSGSLILKRI